MDAPSRTGGFVVAGVIGVAVGAAVYAGIRYFGGPKDAARAEGGAGDAGEHIDAIYSLPGAYAFDLGAIPVLRGIATPPATSFWLASSDAPGAQEIVSTFAVNAVSEGMPMPGGALIPPGGSGTMIEFANALEHQDPELLTPDAVAASVWVVLLHANEPALTVAAVAAALAKVRVAQPTRRIVWLLSKSTPATYAKAINERTPHEEWFRATSDDAAQAAIDWAVLTAPTADALSKLAAPASPGT